jgi:hypothetical protein
MKYIKMSIKDSTTDSAMNKPKNGAGYCTKDGVNVL